MDAIVIGAENSHSTQTFFRPIPQRPLIPSYPLIAVDANSAESRERPRFRITGGRAIAAESAPAVLQPAAPAWPEPQAAHAALPKPARSAAPPPPISGAGSTAPTVTVEL